MSNVGRPARAQGRPPRRWLSYRPAREEPEKGFCREQASDYEDCRIVATRKSRGKADATKLSGVNACWRQLTSADIEAGEHKNLVGGMWEEIGTLRIEFLEARGLLPGHRLVDIGCGALRGGVRFVRYLDEGNHYGLDINESSIEAGKTELAQSGLASKRPNLLVDDKFEVSRFGVSFDYAIAVSVFTHLYANDIIRCLVEIKPALKPEGKFFATFFEAPSPAHLPTIEHHPGGIVTNLDMDPFHYSFSEMQYLAEVAGLAVEYVGDWEHPRNQRMLCFSPGAAG